MLNNALTFLSDNKSWLFPLFQFIVLLLFTIVLNKSYTMITTFLSTHSLIAYLLLRAFYLPFLSFIYVSCFKLLLPYFTQHIPLTLQPLELNQIYQVVVFALFIWFVGRFTGTVKNYLLSSDLVESTLNDKMIYFVFELFYWTLILIFLLGSLQLLQIDIAPKLHTIAKGIIIWSFTFIFLYTVHIGVSENIRVLSEKGEFLGSVIFKAISWPILAMVFGGGFIFFIHMSELSTYLLFPLTFRDIFIICFFWALFRASSLVEGEFLLGRLTRHYPDKTRVQAIANFVRIGTMIIGSLFFLLDKIEYMREILLWLGGSSTVLLAFAAQAIIGNYLSGIVMYLEGNFKVGDWIYSTDRSIEGVIEYMGMRITTLRTLDKRLLYIPNSFFSTANIINATKMTNRRIDEVIPIERVPSETMQEITYELKAMLKANSDIDHYLPTMAHLTEFGPSSLNISIRAFTKTKELSTYRSVRQDLFLSVMNIIQKHGVGLAPTHIIPEKTSSNSEKKL